MMVMIKGKLGKKGNLEISDPQEGSLLATQGQRIAAFTPDCRTTIVVYDDEDVSEYEAKAKLYNHWESVLATHIEDAVKTLAALEAVRTRILPARIKADRILMVNQMEIEESKGYVD